ncbi:3391_t:CDS:2, partial [Acaulospora colombiana]
KEVAEEDSGRGLFTRNLLKKLGEVGDSQTTYSELIRQISLPRQVLILLKYLTAISYHFRQNAQCEGRNQNRICFSSDVLSRFVSYPFKKSNEDYVIEAGEANGVTTGAIFAVYKERGSMLSSDPIALFEALRPDKFSTKMNPVSKLRGDINEGAVAVQIKGGVEEGLRIHCAQDKTLKKLAKTVSQKAADDKKKAYNFEIVDTREGASLGISLESKEVAFHILDEAVTKYGIKRMPFRVPSTVDDLYRVLVAAAHYYWHYSREPAKSPKAPSPPVAVEFLELKPVPGGERILEPCSSNLVKNQTIDITGDEDKFYGIKITNMKDFPIYVSVFYFDHSSLEILSYYQPPTGHGKVDPSIEPKGSLSIGYGSSGAEPYGYVVSGDADIEVGFLKETRQHSWGRPKKGRQPTVFLVYGEDSHHNTRRGMMEQ